MTDADGKRLMVVRGKWNANCEIAKCDEDGEPQGAFERVWEARAKPEGDPYGFTYFARELNRARGFSPRPSDSRRRPDRCGGVEGWGCGRRDRCAGVEGGGLWWCAGWGASSTAVLLCCSHARWN